MMMVMKREREMNADKENGIGDEKKKREKQL